MLRLFNLLAVAHNYEQQKKKALLLKPSIDDRFGLESVKSRAGLSRTADLIVGNDTDLVSTDFKGVSCILVDEAQFFQQTTYLPAQADCFVFKYTGDLLRTKDGFQRPSF